MAANAGWVDHLWTKIIYSFHPRPLLEKLKTAGQGCCFSPVIQLVLMVHWISAQHVPLIYSMQVDFVKFSFKTASEKKNDENV